MIPSIEHNLTRATVFSQWLSQAVMTEDQTQDPLNRVQALKLLSHSDLLKKIGVSQPVRAAPTYSSEIHKKR